MIIELLERYSCNQFLFRQIAAEETRHLMVAADNNHDLLLSFDEILSNHDIFVGSEVTDFGEHLENIHTIIDEL